MKVTYSWQVANSPFRPNQVILKKFIFLAAKIAKLPINLDWNFNIVFLADKAMEKANWDFVGHEGTTDVITFSYLDNLAELFPEDIGLELLICADVALREGKKRVKSSFEYEMALYIVHGILHAANFDDLDPISRRKMRRKEREVLKKLADFADFHTLFKMKNKEIE